MRRIMTTIVVMGALVWAYHTGYSARQTQQNVALAQEAKITLTEGQLSEQPRNQSDDLPVLGSELRDEPAFEMTSTGAQMKRPAANRFNRGRLNEEFDGEIYRSRKPESSVVADSSQSTDVFAESPAQKAPFELAQANPQNNDGILKQVPTYADPASSFPTTALAQKLSEIEENPSPPASAPRRRELVPVPSVPIRRRPAVEGDDHEAPPFVAPRVTPVDNSHLSVPVRVTLIIGKEHQIRIVPESKTPAELLKQVPGGMLVLTAEEFNLVSPTAPDEVKQVHCTGSVQVVSELFEATCSKLSFIGTSLVLEGTKQNRVEVKRQAVGTASEFHLSAEKISLTLSLDKIEIGGGVTISSVQTGPIADENVTSGQPSNTRPQLSAEEQKPQPDEPLNRVEPLIENSLPESGATKEPAADLSVPSTSPPESPK